ncbi:MAG: CRTAC1 family protein [Acidobacteria bacterium]|nr:MAG: CRTAC1 family protein [Acidobacteriota bacterium]
MKSLIAALVLSAISILAQSGQPSIQFTDVTKSAGLTFVHYTGAFGKKYLPETLGPGVAFIDYDGDGWQDLFFTNGKDWPGQHRRTATLQLFRNNHNGTFTDVTRAAGLAVEVYALGVAVGDYDNDGDDDLFVTAVGQNRLFRNTKGVFADVTKEAGLAGPSEFSTSAAWLDFDRDGNLDLIVGNYVQWTPETDLFCTLDGTRKSYCTPESYKGASVRLWRNRRDGTFEDVTRTAGLLDNTSKTLGIAVLDANQDLWPDILLANDTQPNRLYINNGKGGFAERGILSGIAFSEEGIARAGMGVDAADYDRSGYPSVMITNFANQMLALYHNEGNGLFVDEAPRSAVGRATLLTLGFGCFFFDYDLDGWLDIFVANGHVDSDIERIQSRIKYAQPPHVFRNTSKGAFEAVTQSLGAALHQPRVGRGAAYGDFDNDGDLDVVMTTNGGPAVLLRNDGVSNHSLRIRLVGSRTNRNGFGAVVRVTAGGETQTQMLRSGSSYLSQSENILTFGLGTRMQADSLEIRWPSGAVDRMSNVKSGGVVTLTER